MQSHRCAVAARLLAAPILVAFCLTGCEARNPPAPARAVTEPLDPLPAPTAPPVREVRAELMALRSGTGISVPDDLHLGPPLRMFELRSHMSAHSRVRELIEPQRIALYYDILSPDGLEGSLWYVPWDPEASSVGDCGEARDSSDSVVAMYEDRIARLPSAGPSPMVGILKLRPDYDVAIAWTTTSSVGVFYAGLGGGMLQDEAYVPPPYIPTGVVYRDEELAEQIKFWASQQ